MPIVTLPDHSMNSFDNWIRCMQDAIERAKGRVTQHNWDQADLGYCVEQLTKARMYLGRAEACAVAQMVGHEEAERNGAT
jgi:hypothetical protein